MPDWSPNWLDVDFDHAAAEAAAAAYDDAADTLAAGEVTFGDLVAHTVVDWSGGARGDFDDGTERIEDERVRVIRALRDAADAIRTGAAAATAEQEHREAERDRWQAEVEAERAAAEDPRPVGGPV